MNKLISCRNGPVEDTLKSLINILVLLVLSLVGTVDSQLSY
jgi:hypothetical protein